MSGQRSTRTGYLRGQSPQAMADGRDGRDDAGYRWKRNKRDDGTSGFVERRVRRYPLLRTTRGRPHGKESGYHGLPPSNGTYNHLDRRRQPRDGVGSAAAGPSFPLSPLLAWEALTQPARPPQHPLLPMSWTITGLPGWPRECPEPLPAPWSLCPEVHTGTLMAGGMSAANQTPSGASGAVPRRPSHGPRYGTPQGTPGLQQRAAPARRKEASTGLAPRGLWLALSALS